MKKRYISVINWERYQARSDKELPWFKLWGKLFRTPWFQDLEDRYKFVCIAILDLARQFNNKIDSDLLFKGYFSRVYGMQSVSNKDVIELYNSLLHNEFLSDNCPTNVRLEGDKIRVDKSESDRQPSKFSKPSLEELKNYFSEKLSPTCGSPLSEAERFFNYYESKGWVVGKSPMKNWHSAVANWIGNLKERTKTYTTPNPNKKYLDGKKAFDAEFNKVF